MSGSTDMFGNAPADYTTAGGGSVQALIDASTGVNSGWAFDTPKTADTATTDAIQSMAPVQAGVGAPNDYSSFWQGLVGSIVNTGTAIVAKKNGLIQPGNTTPTAPATAPQPPNQNRMILLAALGIGVVLLITRKAA